MSEPSPIERSQGPAGQGKKTKGAEPDPEKFKELLKTDESDDTKKQKKKEQELNEDLDEELSDEVLEERASIFQSFMQRDPDTSEELFKDQGAGSVRESSPTSQFVSDNDNDYDQMYFTQKSDESSSSREDDRQVIEAPNLDKAKEKSVKEASSSFKKARELQNKKHSKQKMKGDIAETVIKVTQKSKEKGVPPPLSPEKITTEKKKSGAKALKKAGMSSKKIDDSSPIKHKTEIEKQNIKKLEFEARKKATLLLHKKGEDLLIKEKPEKAEEESKASKPLENIEDVVIGEAPISPQTTTTTGSFRGSAPISGIEGTTKSGALGATAAKSQPIYTKFSRQNFALFQKLVGLMTVETLKGITKTEITLTMKNSIYNGLVVRLDHYDTNPHMFNLHFYCSPEAQSALIANISSLTQGFEQGNFSFKVNIQNPSLLKEKKIKKVEKSTKDNIK